MASSENITLSGGTGVHSRDFVADLINMYKVRPCLWQSTHKDYKNKLARIKALRGITTLCKAKVSTATQKSIICKLKVLIATYRRELAKIKMSSQSGAGSDNAYVPRIWYFNHLSFLGDQFTENVDSDVGIIGTNRDDDYEEFEFEDMYRAQVPSPADSVMSDTTLKRLSSRADEILEKIAKKMDEIPINAPDTQPLLHQAFGNYVVSKLRQMKPEMIPYCQKLISDIIFNAELGLLNSSSRIETPNHLIMLGLPNEKQSESLQ